MLLNLLRRVTGRNRYVGRHRMTTVAVRTH